MEPQMEPHDHHGDREQSFSDEFDDEFAVGIDEGNRA